MSLSTMKDIKLYLQFYKSTLVLNWSFSVCLSTVLYLIQGAQVLYVFPVFSMSFGFLFALVVKESAFSNEDEYYFYYNAGITKIKLITFSSAMNIIFGSILIIGYFYGKQYVNY
jgi:hypothetical protein